MTDFPKCPKCGSDMVPLSGEYYGRFIMIFYKWKCVNNECKYEVS